MGYDIAVVGRALAGLFDVATILFIFLLGQRLFGPRAGLLAALLYAFAVLPIQHAHFYVADPFMTCFATAAILSIYPARARLAAPAFVSAVTGSSGSGAKPADITHHPYRATTLSAYAPFDHRHVAEIRAAVGCDFVFQPHSGPFVRGIFATTFLTLTGEAPLDYAYDGARFVRVRETSPNIHWVKNSNFADLHVAQRGTQAVVFCAIDNLLKGGAGQAVQCMNLMFGLPEDAGLTFAGGNP